MSVENLHHKINKLEQENKALKERIEFLENALDIAYEDDAAGYEDLMAEAHSLKEKANE